MDGPYIRQTTTAGTETWNPGRKALAVGAGATFAVTFLFRFATVDFTNDHFVHLSRGQQILFGDLPVRDFFDPGLILQYYASALALALSDRTLFGEAVLTVGFIALGAALTFALSARLSRSLGIGAAAALVSVAAFPRLYNYPKAFLYVLALAAAWIYVQRPDRVRLGGLAVVTSLAFLWRHDHGLYIGMFVAAMLAILWRRDARQGLATVGSFVCLVSLLLLPFVLFVQSTAGLKSYALGGLPQASGVAQVRVNRLPIDIDGSLPWLVVDPPVERRVHVRWKPEAGETIRRALESRYGLAGPLPVGDTTWSYLPTDDRRDTLRALVEDPMVDDTHGIDRSSAELAFDESLIRRVDRAIPLLRTRVLPGILTVDNALAWSYYVELLLPLLGFAWLVRLAVGHRTTPSETALVGAAILLCFVIVQTLVRGSPDSRVPDVAGPLCVLGAWTAGRWLHPERHGEVGRAPGRRRLVWGAVVPLWLITLWSFGAQAGIGAKIATTGLHRGPPGLLARLNEAADQLRLRPIESDVLGNAGIGVLARYVLECTIPSDRVLFIGFAPQLFFYAERPFAGGQVYLHPGYHSSPADQRLTVERLARQRVPIVVSDDTEAEDFERRFPIVYAYVQQHYRPAAESRFGGDRRYTVRVDRDLTPTGTYEPASLAAAPDTAAPSVAPPTRLPCYR